MVLQLTDFTSEITDEELLEFTSEYYIPFALHPVVPAASASIADFPPEGKVGVYTNVSLILPINVKELASPKQMALELAILGQMATGKESLNPFMTGSLPKTIHLCDSLQSDEDSFELIELMILCTNFLTMVRDLENLKTTYLIMKKVWVRMHPNRGGLMMQMQRLPSLMRLQMMLETRTTRFQTAIRSEEVFGYILLVIKKLTLKKLDD
ncbi:hypothetical protein Tco_1256647 [Tanacetum coccineum]